VPSSAPSGRWRGGRCGHVLPARGALRFGQLMDGRVEHLLLGRLILHRSLKYGDLILERLQGLHLQFDGVQATQDGVEGGVDVTVGTGDKLRTHLGGSNLGLLIPDCHNPIAQAR
jgi:hypothetical protein